MLTSHDFNRYQPGITKPRSEKAKKRRVRRKSLIEPFQRVNGCAARAFCLARTLGALKKCGAQCRNKELERAADTGHVQEPQVVACTFGDHACVQLAGAAGDDSDDEVDALVQLLEPGGSGAVAQVTLSVWQGEGRRRKGVLDVCDFGGRGRGRPSVYNDQILRLQKEECHCPDMRTTARSMPRALNREQTACAQPWCSPGKALCCVLNVAVQKIKGLHALGLRSKSRTASSFSVPGGVRRLATVAEMRTRVFASQHREQTLG